MTFIIVLFLSSLIVAIAYWLRRFVFYISWFLFGVAMLGLPVMFIDLEIGLSMLVYGLGIFVGTWLLIYASAAIVAFVAVPLAILVAFFKSVFRIR